MNVTCERVPFLSCSQRTRHTDRNNEKSDDTSGSEVLQEQNGDPNQQLRQHFDDCNIFPSSYAADIGKSLRPTANQIVDPDDHIINFPILSGAQPSPSISTRKKQLNRQIDDSGNDSRRKSQFPHIPKSLKLETLTFKRDFCSKTFTNKRNRDLHHNIHTGAKLFECN